MFQKFRSIVLGKTLAIRQSQHERLTKSQGLAVFASDALSSTAYATEEILLVLGAASVATFISIPIALTIAGLILIVSLSYRQAIYAYPQGGGVYNVAKMNLGENFALVGAASLIIDYILTVAVSVTAGVVAITSAFPWLYPHRIALGVGTIILITLINLRGVRFSGRSFSIPVYLFIASLAGMIGYGLYLKLTGSLPHADPAENISTFGALGVLLILRAFSSGCTAMTGIEATPNGVQTFKPPESKNAAITMMWMAFILSSIFVGVTMLAHWTGVMPDSANKETVLSRVARLLFDQTPLYFTIQAATALILFLAANTPFADFPRVVSQLARDGYFPRQFYNIGTRLVFANGILFLAVVSSMVVIEFNGNVHALIPLYAVGVFLGFSISQFGMISHWRREGSGNSGKMILNAVGCVATSFVFLVVFISKFHDGAWLLLPTSLFLIFVMKRIKAHYNNVRELLTLDGPPVPDVRLDTTMVLLAADINRKTIFAIKRMKLYRPAHIQAFHVAFTPDEEAVFRKKWEKNISGVDLDIEVSEDRAIIGSTIQYLKKLQRKWDNDEVVVVMPQFIPARMWHHFLHNHTGLRLRLAIEQDPDLDMEILDVVVKRTTKPR